MSKVKLILAVVSVLCFGLFIDNVHAGTGKPNIVFILTDDLSWNLIQYMPNVQAMQKEGTTFANYFVADSLCCPSRSTIFTGKLPHDTGVFTNDPNENGGYKAFIDNNNQKHTFALELQNDGYKTALLGKYLNGYKPHDDVPALRPGWSEWDASGGQDAYNEHNYSLNENGTPHFYASTTLKENYLTDVVSVLGQQFMDKSKPGPFFIEIATFAPHAPYTPANRHKALFPSLTMPHTKTFTIPNDQVPPWTPSCEWLKDPSIQPKSDQYADEDFLNRVRSVQAVDEMIGAIRMALSDWGIADKTYIIFSSDNGYHMGDYRLEEGKQTPFDTDIRVPLIVVGPQVAKNHIVTDYVAMSPDLCPTFVELAGVSAPTSVFPDGHSLLPLLSGGAVQSWRHSALVEHRNGKYDGFDNSETAAQNPPSYEALRTKDFLYVEYYKSQADIDSGNFIDVTYYDLKSDLQGNGPLCNIPCQFTYASQPCQYYQCAELTNTFANLGPDRRQHLHYALCAYRKCKGSTECFDNQPLQNTQCETFPPPKKCTPYMSKEECCIISGGYWTGKECM